MTHLDDNDGVRTPVASVDTEAILAFRKGVEAALENELKDAPGAVRGAIRGKLNLVCSQLMSGTTVTDPALMDDARLLHGKLGEVRNGEALQQKLEKLVPIIEP